jgi:hypothetical protein
VPPVQAAVRGKSTCPGPGARCARRGAAQGSHAHSMALGAVPMTTQAGHTAPDARSTPRPEGTKASSALRRLSSSRHPSPRFHVHNVLDPCLVPITILLYYEQ